MIQDPYTEQDFEEIARARQVLSSLIPFMDNLEACGTDCKVRRENLAFIDNILASFQNRFWGMAQ